VVSIVTLKVSVYNIGHSRVIRGQAASILEKAGCQSKSKACVSCLKKLNDEMHFCIKKEDDLCFTMSWNKIAIPKKNRMEVHHMQDHCI
jgi:hypothetical protein